LTAFSSRDGQTPPTCPWSAASICGQAPSNYPEFARFLVQRGIGSISLNPDAIVRGLETIAAAERDLERAECSHRS
jgi:phosphoenolpyruvate synthase/pyruvate phosphate dikinase